MPRGSEPRDSGETRGDAGSSRPGGFYPNAQWVHAFAGTTGKIGNEE